MALNPVTAIIVGGGHRSFTYAQFALEHPDALKIVGIADPNPDRRMKARQMFGISDALCFDSAEALAGQPRLADAVINGTMDHQHVETAVPLLALGYDMLLEKPFAVNMEEMRRLLAAVHTYRNKVMICHVLRYAPFYRAVKDRLLCGELGAIINLQTVESVSYHHLSTSYVRGKWGNSELCKTSMLLAKCCHDLDIVMWLMDGDAPQAVSSFGGILQFKPENAPADAGTRCLVDCPRKDSCDYSAKRLYIDHPKRWAMYVWDAFAEEGDAPIEKKLALLQGESPYGKCIYKAGNNVVDHQSVLLRFASGATATHNMVGGSARSTRTLHITGTRGELYGDLDAAQLTLRRICTDSPAGFTCEEIDVAAGGGAHGGGDMELVRDFVRYVRTGEQSVACTAIENSIAGHYAVFLADKSMAQDGTPQSFDFTQFP